MIYIKQLLIILAICLFAEALAFFVPIGLPASILAMVVLFGLLSCKVIKEKDIASVSDLLLQLMPIFILPGSVTIIKYLPIVQSVWWQLIVVCVVGAVVTFFCAFFTTQWMMKLVQTKEEDKSNV